VAGVSLLILMWTFVIFNRVSHRFIEEL
jgi:hypothetical protein